MSGTLKVVCPSYTYCMACMEPCLARFEAVGQVDVPYAGGMRGVSLNPEMVVVSGATADLCDTCAAPFLPPPAAGVGTFVATAAHGPTNVTVTDDDTVPPELLRLGAYAGGCYRCIGPGLHMYLYETLRPLYVSGKGLRTGAFLAEGAVIALCGWCSTLYSTTDVRPAAVPVSAPRCGCGSTSTYGTQAYAIGHSDYCPVRALCGPI